MPKPFPEGILIRHMAPTDILSVAELIASAPDDGSLYQFPQLVEQAEEMKKMHVEWLCKTVRDETILVRLAVISSQNNRIVGYSSWLKKESAPETGSIRNENWKLRLRSDEDEEKFLRELEEQVSINSTSGLSWAHHGIKAHKEAVVRARKQAPSPSATNLCYELNGLAIHSEFQGCGIGTMLVRWGLKMAANDDLPVFASGEGRGVDFYVRALGFQRVAAGEYWLDNEGRDISKEEVQRGNRAWERETGGLSGATVVWLPERLEIVVDGCTYKG